MSNRRYHLGRRKRRIIMHERAFAVAFNINPDERRAKFPLELRTLLEALVDTDAAYSGNANMDRCLAAGEAALEKSTTHVSDKISQLKILGFIRFKSFSGGSQLVIDDTILNSFSELEKYASIIDYISRFEDRNAAMDEKCGADIQKLKDKNIYVGHSDAELDKTMRDIVDPVVEERRSTRQTKKDKVMNRSISAKSSALKTACGFFAVILIGASMLSGTADASVADRGGTVGLSSSKLQSY